MKIELRNGKIASGEMISLAEDTLGFQLTLPFKKFVQSNDGAKPNSNIFKVGNDNNCGVNQFIPVKQIPGERKYIENLPKKAYPVAWAECGNYVYIDETEGGAVYFWDHEMPEDVVKLAPNFSDFLKMLEPFDVKSITLKPGEVKSVWVHPDFLKLIKKESDE